MKEILNFIFVGHGPWVFIGVLFLFGLLCEEFCLLIKTILEGFAKVIHGEPKVYNNYINSDKQEEKVEKNNLKTSKA